MTSASELFYNWRSRGTGRNPGHNPSLGLDPPLPSDRDHPDLLLHRRCRSRSHRRRLHHLGGDCDASVRHRGVQSEHEPVRSDNNSPHGSGSGNNSNVGTSSSRVNRLALIRNEQGSDRLPGTVVQARARLLERLRGLSLTGNRQNSASSSISWDEFAASDDFGVIHSETEPPREWAESGIQFIDLADEVSLPDVSKKPPGLSSESMLSLPQEFFKDGQESNGEARASIECCICLERFSNSERLFRLPCDHTFHTACLEPWLKTCGDCPYCRASI